MLEVLGEPGYRSTQQETPKIAPTGRTPSEGSTPRLALKEGAGFSTTWTEDQLGLVPAGDPAAPSLSCVQAGPAACPVPTDHTPPAPAPACRTRPGSTRAILKGTRDCLVLGSGRAGASAGRTGHAITDRFFPTNPSQEPEPPGRRCSASPSGPGGGSSLSRPGP